MNSRSNEVAAAIVDESIDLQSIAAARANPGLKILCLRCNDSVWGGEFEAHLQVHRVAQTPAPAHWEAL